MGLYQQRKEQGVKSMSQRMERPKSTPFDESVVKKARHASTLRNRVTQLTGKTVEKKKSH